MKRGKKLLILLAVLLVLTAATALATRLGETEEAEAEEVVIFAVDTADITALSWTYEGTTLSFTWADAIWTYDGDEAFDVDSAAVTAIAEELAAVVAYRTIDEPGALADYGLSDPVCTITVNGDESLTLFLGDETGIGGQRYASIDDGKVYLVDESLMSGFDVTLEDLEEETEAATE